MHIQPARSHDVRTWRLAQLSTQLWLQEATAQFAAAHSSGKPAQSRSVCSQKQQQHFAVTLKASWLLTLTSFQSLAVVMGCRKLVYD